MTLTKTINILLYFFNCYWFFYISLIFLGFGFKRFLWSSIQKALLTLSSFVSYFYTLLSIGQCTSDDVIGERSTRDEDDEDYDGDAGNYRSPIFMNFDTWNIAVFHTEWQPHIWVHSFDHVGCDRSMIINKGYIIF